MIVEDSYRMVASVKRSHGLLLSVKGLGLVFWGGVSLVMVQLGEETFTLLGSGCVFLAGMCSLISGYA